MTIQIMRNKYSEDTKDKTLEVTPDIDKKMRLLANILIDRFLEDRQKGILQPNGIPYNVISTTTI